MIFIIQNAAVCMYRTHSHILHDQDISPINQSINQSINHFQLYQLQAIWSDHRFVGELLLDGLRVNSRTCLYYIVTIIIPAVGFVFSTLLTCACHKWCAESRVEDSLA